MRIFSFPPPPFQYTGEPEDRINVILNEDWIKQCLTNYLVSPFHVQSPQYLQKQDDLPSHLCCCLPKVLTWRHCVHRVGRNQWETRFRTDRAGQLNLGNYRAPLKLGPTKAHLDSFQMSIRPDVCCLWEPHFSGSFCIGSVWASHTHSLPASLPHSSCNWNINHIQWGRSWEAQKDGYLPFFLHWNNILTASWKI